MYRKYMIITKTRYKNLIRKNCTSFLKIIKFCMKWAKLLNTSLKKNSKVDFFNGRSMRAHVLKRNDQLSKMLKKSEEENQKLLQ